MGKFEWTVYFNLSEIGAPNVNEFTSVYTDKYVKVKHLALYGNFLSPFSIHERECSVMIWSHAEAQSESLIKR